LSLSFSSIAEIFSTSISIIESSNEFIKLTKFFLTFSLSIILSGNVFSKNMPYNELLKLITSALINQVLTLIKSSIFNFAPNETRSVLSFKEISKFSLNFSIEESK